MKPVSGPELARAAERRGWALLRINGSHHIYGKAGEVARLSIPCHGNNQREPNNRYDVFKDIARLEQCQDVADLGFVLVATDHPHYVAHAAYSGDTGDFDLRDGKSYKAGSVLTYRTGRYDSIALVGDYHFKWVGVTTTLSYLLVEVSPALRAAPAGRSSADAISVELRSSCKPSPPI